MSRPEVAAASKADRLATINRLAAEYAKEHDAQLRPRAQKIVALETLEAEPVPVKKAEPSAHEERQEGRLNFQTCNNGAGLNPGSIFIWPWRRARACARIARSAGVVVPDIITVAWAAICGAPGRLHTNRDQPRGRRRADCALVKTYAHYH